MLIGADGCVALEEAEEQFPPSQQVIGVHRTGRGGCGAPDGLLHSLRDSWSRGRLHALSLKKAMIVQIQVFGQVFWKTLPSIH